ncbi:hypothetical protein M0R19_06350 [Candidatus Pacearchaeota archaeon]|jgi:hypothetical protein|nr:hypothetical protein [Candidatus Pacearchaeota archaeon]
MSYKDNLKVTQQLQILAAGQSINNIDTGRIIAYSNSKKIYTIQLLDGGYVKAVAPDSDSNTYPINATVEVTKTKNIGGTVSILRYAPGSASSNLKTYLV